MALALEGLPHEDVNDLVDWAAPYNPRVPSAPKMRALRASLKKFGVVEPVVVNRRSEAKGWPPGSMPCMVGGHQRTALARDEGLESLPVSWVDLGEIDEKELNLALNNPAADWDDPVLASILLEIQAADGDLEVTGFTGQEIESLLGEIGPGEMFGDGISDGGASEESHSDESQAVVSIGPYRVKVERDDFNRWHAELREAAGFDKDAEQSAILERLGL